MAIVLAALSALIVVVAAYGVALPRGLIGLVRRLMSRAIGLWIAVGSRLLLAALLWLTAPVSRTPTMFMALAVLVFLAAVSLIAFGRRRLEQLMETLGSWPPWAIRLPCLLGVALGGFLIWSVSPALPGVAW